TSIVEIQFTTAFDASDFNAVATQLLDVFGPAGTNQITSDDILWNGVTTVHVAADPDIDPNLGTDIINEINTNNPPDFSAVDFLSTGVAPFDREFVNRTLLLDNHTEAANVSKLINRIHGSTPGEVTGLVSTNLNIEIGHDAINRLPYESGYYFEGESTLAASNAIKALQPMTLTVTFESGDQSEAYANIASSAEQIYDLQKNGTSFGSVTFAVGVNAGTVSIPVSTTLNPGDRLEIFGPGSPDGTLDQVAITLSGFVLI
ncbi:MAG: hypothetical protein WDZ68_00005, partial [Candidatus Paceibacterota bacterium]